MTRYLALNLTRDHNITTGKIYKHVIEKERRGDYLGKTVQVVPHVTDAIQEIIDRVSKIPVDNSGEEPDVCIGMFKIMQPHPKTSYADLLSLKLNWCVQLS